MLILIQKKNLILLLCFIIFGLSGNLSAKSASING